MIRRRERRGEKEFNGMGLERRSFIFSRVWGWKFARELRFWMLVSFVYNQVDGGYVLL